MNYAVILAGGAGSRLWPLSNARQPKQLVALADGETLLEKAWNRLDGVVPAQQRFVCGGEAFREISASNIPELGQPRSGHIQSAYIGEPEGRDTLAALCLASAIIATEDSGAVIALLTSDHLFNPVGRLKDALRAALALVTAQPEMVVTFGIKPTRPETGFGWLELSRPREDAQGVSAHNEDARAVTDYSQDALGQTMRKEATPSESTQRKITPGASVRNEDAHAVTDYSNDGPVQSMHKEATPSESTQRKNTPGASVRNEDAHAVTDYSQDAPGQSMHNPDALGTSTAGIDLSSFQAIPVVRFHEKPTLAKAQEYLACGNYLWNSGMAVWQVKRFLELVQCYEPEIFSAITAVAAHHREPDFNARLSAVYKNLKRISVDHGIWERYSQEGSAALDEVRDSNPARLQAMPEANLTVKLDAKLPVNLSARLQAMPLDIEWEDIGSWLSFSALIDKDSSGNAARGNGLFSKCTGSFAYSEENEHLVACLGCEDLIVVHTHNATLVCPKERAQEVKELYSKVLNLESGRWA